MAAIRSRGNKATELKLASILRAARITGWRRHQPVPGRPDFVFQRQRLAVFVDGCFWHGCPKHGRRPATNALFWALKLGKNTRRDRRVKVHLRALGWKVIRLWQHDLRNSKRCLDRIEVGLGKYLKPH
ncbi:MAG: very short patch repair endonuclease [Limisphaerales bacterium]